MKFLSSAATSPLVLGLLFGCVSRLTPSAWAIEPFRIETGGNYGQYSDTELRRRVWQLERAVAQLQEQVFHLSAQSAIRASTPEFTPPPVRQDWTCHMRSFNKTISATAPTKAKAMAEVLTKCSKGSHAIHCPEDSVTCGNE